jgi:hypothetical protein
VNEEIDPALVVERLKVENAMLKSELRSASMARCTILESRQRREQMHLLFVMCRLLRGEAVGEEIGPEMQQHLQGRIDLYLSDRQAELGIKLDSMPVVQTGEHCAVLQWRCRFVCCAIVQLQNHVCPLMHNTPAVYSHCYIARTLSYQ